MRIEGITRGLEYGEFNLNRSVWFCMAQKAENGKRINSCVVQQNTKHNLGFGAFITTLAKHAKYVELIINKDNQSII